MNDAITIRKAVAADASALAACIDAAYAPYCETIPDLPDVSAGISEDIANNQVWVAMAGHQIVAGMVLIAADGFKLANVAVDPAHGGKGLGRKLITHAEDEARRQGFSQMRLNTHAAMPQNVALYEKLGWEVTARDGNVVGMVKEL